MIFGTGRLTSSSQEKVLSRRKSDHCVCGHDRDSHCETSLSVPLINPNPKPGYLLGRQSAIAFVYPGATYEHYECHCGCCEYLADDGRS